MDDAGTLTSDPVTSSAPPIDTTSAPITGTLTAPTAPAPEPQPLQNLQPAAPAPVNPKFQRTFANTLKGLLLGELMGGIPGAVQGAIDPQAPQRALDNRRAIAAANQHFADARAAHETLQAMLLEKQVNQFDADHQQTMERIGLENVKAAQDAGFHVVAVSPLDGEVSDNAQAATNNLRQIQQNNGGVVPSGLLHIHAGNGNGIFTMQLTDPAAALDIINKANQAQGLPQLTHDQFMAQPATDRALAAKNAINFTFPTDSRTGQISQDSVTTLDNRLALVQAQPDFAGKDALVKKLQQSYDFQKSALEREAQRKGQATGAEAQAAAPGQAAAEVTKQTALAQTPQGRASIGEAQARIRQANAEADKTLSEMGLGGLKPADPVIGYDANGESILTNAANAKQLGLHDTMKPDAAFVEKVSIARSYIPLNNQLLADIDQLQKSGKLGAAASRWNEFMTGKVGAGDPDFEKFRVDLGLANTALMQFHVGNRGSSAMLEHFQNLADGRKMDGNTLRAGVEAEGDYAAHRAMMPSALAQQISGTKLRQSATPLYGIQKSTGRPAISLDGGKTWQLRQ